MAKGRAPRNQESEEAAAPPLVSRSDSRRKERELEDALSRLAKELVELRPRLVEKLMLPEEVLDTVEGALKAAGIDARPTVGVFRLPGVVRLVPVRLIFIPSPAPEDRDRDWDVDLTAAGARQTWQVTFDSM